MLFYVEPGDRIGRIVQGRFKGAIELCPGLEIRFGDDVRAKVDAWAAARGVRAYRTCELTYNYSENGNVLDEVASLANRIAFTVSNGRATSVAMWK